MIAGKGSDGKPRALDTLRPGQEMTVPLPPVDLGRRAAYQRIQRECHHLFGVGGYRMRAAGQVMTIVRLEKRGP